MALACTMDVKLPSSPQGKAHRHEAAQLPSGLLVHVCGMKLYVYVNRLWSMYICPF